MQWPRRLKVANECLTNTFEHFNRIWLHLPYVACHHCHCLLEGAGRQDFFEVCFNNLGGGNATEKSLAKQPP